MHPREERVLIRKIQSGDRQALTGLWDEFTPKLFGYLVNITHDQVLAEDLLQTTWLKALTALPNYQSQGTSIGGWLFAIARNECRQHWRTAGREVPLDPVAHDMAAPNNEDLETKLAIEKVFSVLPEDDREILRLRYLADLPVADIANLLRLNFVAVRVRLHRAVTRARRAFINQPL